MTLRDIRDHLIQAAGAALLIGGGATIIQTKVDVARHDERITRIEELDKSMDRLSEEVAKTREELARVSAKQEK